MFVKNPSQQLTLEDPIHTLPKYLRGILEKIWAQAFGAYIFPYINEGLFGELYSDHPASRPNTPVNILMGLFFLKEIFQLSDEELMDSMYFDIRYQ